MSIKPLHSICALLGHRKSECLSNRYTIHRKIPREPHRGRSCKSHSGLNSLIFAPGACEAALERTEAAPKWEGAKASGRR